MAPTPQPSDRPRSFERKAARAYGRGCFHFLLFQLAGLWIGLLLLVWVLWFVGSRVVAGETTRGEILAATGLPILGLVVAATLTAWWIVRRRGQRLDHAFFPWCGEGSQSGPAMRGWHGHAGRRRLDAWVSRGPKVELYLECDARTRAWINRGGPVMRRVNRLLNKEPVDIEAARQLGVAVYTEDTDWTRRLLDQPAARIAIEQLMKEQPKQASTALNVLPSCLHFMKTFLPLDAINRQQTVGWVDALGELAEAIESLAPPATLHSSNSGEEWARRNRGGDSVNRILAWVYGVGLFLLLALILAFTYVLPLGR